MRRGAVPPHHRIAHHKPIRIRAIDAELERTAAREDCFFNPTKSRPAPTAGERRSAGIGIFHLVDPANRDASTAPLAPSQIIA